MYLELAFKQSVMFGTLALKFRICLKVFATPKKGHLETIQEARHGSFARCRYHWNIAQSKLTSEFWILNSFSPPYLSPSFVPVACCLLSSLYHMTLRLFPPPTLAPLGEISPFLCHLWSHSLLVFLLLLCSLSVSLAAALTLECFCSRPSHLTHSS